MGKRPVAERFWAKVDRGGPDECWDWTGAKSRNGYGRFGSYRMQPAHRVAYEMVVGPVPAGLVLDHLCRNRACVNPAHLEPVTNRENLLRGVGIVAVEARLTHCPSGHPYSDDNTKSSANGRQCRQCKRDHDAVYRVRHRGEINDRQNATRAAARLTDSREQTAAPVEGMRDE